MSVGPRRHEVDQVQPPGQQLGSRSAVADSKQALLCTYLSAVLLVGLGLNTMSGWWWADPAAALVIAAVAVREGREARRGDACCTPTAAISAATGPAQGGCCCGDCRADNLDGPPPGHSGRNDIAQS